MDARRSPSSTLRRVAVMASLAALLAPAGVAEAAKKKIKLPVVTSVKPMEASVGETLTIYGKNFRRGKGKNSVVFKRDGARALFVKADVATSKQVKVIVPKKLEDFMLVKDGVVTATRFRVRVLAKRLGKSFTYLSRSPVLGPEKPKSETDAPKVAAPDGDCDGDGILNGSDTDDDNDLLDDGFETSVKLDPCKRDSDGDGVEDGFEYRSARDLNDDTYQSPDTYLPYPAKRPYPNPLFADASTDYDGDGLTLLDESKLWIRYGTRNLDALNYSDGKQYTLQIAAVAYDKQQAFLAAAAAKGYSQELLLDMDSYDVPGDEDNPLNPAEDTEWTGFPGITDVERYYYDLDKNNRLSDDERDEDADGLPNWVEAHGYMTPEWWKAIYGKEVPFTIAYAGTEIDDPDSDGDGVVDGADDQDHDDFPNVRELSRQLVAGEVEDGSAWSVGDEELPEWIRDFDNPEFDPDWDRPLRAWVNPFNPCIPNPDSRTCPRYVPTQNVYAPFDLNYEPFFVLN